MNTLLNFYSTTPTLHIPHKQIQMCAGYQLKTTRQKQKQNKMASHKE